MAMNKEITKDSGLTTNYHRISKIEINFISRYCNVIIENYVSEEYRNKAKEADDLRKKLMNLQYQIDNNTDTNLTNALNEKYALLLNNNQELLNTDYAVDTNTITLDYIPQDTSYKGFYEEIKKLNTYKYADLI